jgi:hypothetical protein
MDFSGETSHFWLFLLRDVLDNEHPDQFITFEKQEHHDHTGFN